MSEGGFKSKFLNPLANDYIVSSNLGIGLWKWVELYADFGISKNIGSLPKGYYDSGIRLNLLPDFLEIFLPIQSSENQIEFNLNQKTIKQQVELEGIGLHSGKKVKICIKPSNPNSGIYFKRIDLRDSQSSINKDSVETKLPIDGFRLSQGSASVTDYLNSDASTTNTHKIDKYYKKLI